MRRILWKEWRNADYTFTMTRKRLDLVCCWKCNHKCFLSPMYLESYRDREWHGWWRNTHRTAFHLIIDVESSKFTSELAVFLVGNIQHQFVFLVWTLNFPWRVMAWPETTPGFFFLCHQNRGCYSQSRPCRHLTSIYKRKNSGIPSDWFSCPCISVFSAPTINPCWSYCIIPWKLPDAGRCCRLSSLIARQSRAGLQLTVSANAKWQGLWSQGNNRGLLYFPELPEKLSG